MTENTFEAPSEEVVDDGGRRRSLLIAGGAAGVAVLVGCGWFLLHGGSDDSSYGLPAAHAPAVSRSVPSTTTHASKVTAVAKLPAASAVKIGRDPFLALYVAPAAATAGTGTGTTTPTTTGTTTGGSTGTTSGTGTTTAPATPVRYSITLTKVTTDPGGAKLFTFAIGTTTKTVLPAQRFGKYGELVVLTYVKNSKGAVSGAVLQVGDDNPVQVPIGAKISVQ